MPFTATVYSGSTAFNSFYVNPEDLEKQPLQVLLKLGKFLLNNNPMPNIVWIDRLTKKPAIGIDAGGLRRQFVTTLLENLFKEQSGFHFTEELGGKLPLLDDLTHGDQVIALRVFARLIALCATSSLLMGEHLPLNFFYAIKALSDQEIDSISFDKALEEGLRNKIYYSLIGEKFENEMQVGEAVPADVVPMDLDESIGMEIDQEEIVKYPVMRPIAIVAKELKSIQGFSLDLLRNNTETFINRVKGKVVTKEDLLNSMLIENFTIRRYFEKYLEENLR